MSNETCNTCHWWFAPKHERSDMRVCVFHTGMQKAQSRRVDFGGNKPMRTVATFGCTEWERDQREVAE